MLIALLLVLMYPTGRGQRIEGVSWFDIQHEMRGTSKKARGRMQQTKAHRKAKTRR
jgi:hypothetical protein